MKLYMIIICCCVFLYKAPAQTVLANIVTTNPADKFVYDGTDMPHYSLRWGNDSWDIGGSTAWLSAYSGIKLFTQAVPRFTVTGGGYVGIGTVNPTSKMHVAGDNFITIGDYGTSGGVKGIRFTGFRDILQNFYGASIEAEPAWVCCGNYPNGGYPGVKSVSLNFNIHDPADLDHAESKITALSIRNTGNVGIGTIAPTEKLSVNGNIRAKKVIVTQTGWADYVFDSAYRLRSLEEVEHFIRSNKHLPEIISTAEAEQNGIDIGENQVLLLKKIEELTLYIIAQDKAKQVMESRLSEQEILLKQLQDQVNTLQAAVKK